MFCTRIFQPRKMSRTTLSLVLLLIFPATLFCRSISPTDKGQNGRHVLEEGDFFQGDIMLMPGQVDKNGILLEVSRWPNATVIYKLEGVFESEQAQRDKVLDAIAEYHNKTCIQFEEYDGSQEDFVVLTDVDSAGCSSFVGRLGGQQIVHLKVPGCDKVGTIIHELMHAVGFFHEQSREDRDKYVRIIWDYIEAGKEFNFWVTPGGMTFDLEYDYGSIMHYGEKAFSVNDLPTIQAKDPNAIFGQRDGLSTLDVAKLNAMYKCNL